MAAKKPESGGSDEMVADAPEYAEGWSERLASVIDKLGGLGVAAEIAEISPDQLARWRDGKSRASFAGIRLLTRSAGVSLDWLAEGHGEPFETSPALNDVKRQIARTLERDHEQALASIRSGRPEGFLLVPRYDLAVSAGPGTFGDDNIKDYLAFKENWVRGELGCDPKRLALVDAIGDSMEPTIRSGDTLLIDTSVEHVVDDAIYVIGLEEAVMLKRVQRLINGLLVRSDNTAYQPMTLGPEEAQKLRILGRMRWFGRVV